VREPDACYVTATKAPVGQKSQQPTREAYASLGVAEDYVA
jgi:hypothetical protein